MKNLHTIWFMVGGFPMLHWKTLYIMCFMVLETCPLDWGSDGVGLAIVLNFLCFQFDWEVDFSFPRAGYKDYLLLLPCPLWFFLLVYWFVPSIYNFLLLMKEKVPSTAGMKQHETNLVSKQGWHLNLQSQTLCTLKSKRKPLHH